jgi:hypothetical protein
MKAPYRLRLDRLRNILHSKPEHAYASISDLDLDDLDDLDEGSGPSGRLHARRHESFDSWDFAYVSGAQSQSQSQSQSQAQAHAHQSTFSNEEGGRGTAHAAECGTGTRSERLRDSVRSVSEVLGRHASGEYALIGLTPDGTGRGYIQIQADVEVGRTPLPDPASHPEGAREDKGKSRSESKARRNGRVEKQASFPLDRGEETAGLCGNKKAGKTKKKTSKRRKLVGRLDRMAESAKPFVYGACLGMAGAVVWC